MDYVIDGRCVATTEDFYRVVGEAVNGPGGYFGANLDAFGDCLSGGFGTPDDHDFAFVWMHSSRSRAALGHPETVRQLEIALLRCHPTGRAWVGERLEAARRGEGPTVFDRFVEIFEERGVALRLD